MFDVGFWELLLIGGLALIILGPERLPKVAAQLGRWVGRARAMARQLRTQLDQEVDLQERQQHWQKQGTGTAEAAKAPSESPPGEGMHDPPAADPADIADTADTAPQAGSPAKAAHDS